MYSASRLPAPAAPAGHWSRLASPSAIGMFARVAHDPESPAFVRQTHGQLLSLSLSMLADSVRTVSTR
jgi:hypothetical protein